MYEPDRVKVIQAEFETGFNTSPFSTSNSNYFIHLSTKNIHYKSIYKIPSLHPAPHTYYVIDFQASVSKDTDFIA